MESSRTSQLHQPQFQLAVLKMGQGTSLEYQPQPPEREKEFQPILRSNKGEFLTQLSKNTNLLMIRQTDSEIQSISRSVKSSEKSRIHSDRITDLLMRKLKTSSVS
jgi:hypothetical protein